jgi:hypothetical protein
MPTFENSRIIDLRNRLQELEQALEVACPALVAEIRRVKEQIKAIEKEPSEVYVDASTPREAIRRCLDLSGDWVLTRSQMIDAIIDGGYFSNKPMADKPKTMRGLLNDSIRYQISTGNLALRGDLVGRP